MAVLRPRDRLVDDLSVITGEELMNLLNHLQTALDLCHVHYNDRGLRLRHRREMLDLIYEIEPVREDALLQIARIQVPMIEAQRIIWRAVFARRRPFRVNPQ